MLEQLKEFPVKLEQKVKDFSAHRSWRWGILGMALLASCSTTEAAPAPVEHGMIYPGIIKIDKKARVRADSKLGNNFILGQWNFVKHINGTWIGDRDFIVLQNPWIIEDENADDDMDQDSYSKYWVQMQGTIRSLGRMELGENKLVYTSMANKGYTSFDREIPPIEVMRLPDREYIAVDYSATFQNPGEVLQPK
jgi:hypothetical protein